MVTSAPCSAPCSPHYSILGRISDTDVYRDVMQYEMVTAPGMGEELPATGGSSKHPSCGSLEKGAGAFWWGEGRRAGGSIPGVAPSPSAPRHRRSLA